MFVLKQKTAYDVRISDGSSDVFSSDLGRVVMADPQADSASAMALVAPRAERETSGVSDAEVQARLVPLAQHYGERASAQQPVAERLAAVSSTTKQMVPVSEQVWLEARRANRRVHAVVPQTGT